MTTGKRFTGRDDYFALASNPGPKFVTFVYRTEDSLDDLLTPGYFDKARDWGLREWHEIEATCGATTPMEATFARLVVVDVPTSRENPVRAALIRADKVARATKGAAK